MHPPRATNAGEPTTVELRNDRAEIDRLEAAIVEAAQVLGYPRESQFAIRLAIEEAIANAFEHGHRDLPDEPVRVEYELGPTGATFSVEDRGPGFTPEAVPDPTLDENIVLARGRGLMLIRAYMTEVRHNQTGNRLEMSYTLPKTES